MAPYSQYLIIAVSAIVLIAITLRTIRIARTIRLQRYIASDAPGCHHTLGSAGCSILCHGIDNIEDIQHLLSDEHCHYEVIISLDADTRPKLFDEIIIRYKMIRVEAPDSSEFRHKAIRRLYRSRQRCFRRLVLLDKAEDSPYDDINAAAAVSSYDYLLPIGRGTLLRQGAVSSLAIIISECRHKPIDIVYSHADGSVLFRRDAVASLGGFSADIHRRIAHSRRQTTYIPIFENFRPLPREYIIRTITPTLLLTTVAIIIGGYQAALIVLATMLASLAAIRYTLLLTDEKCSLTAIVCHILHIRLFFYPRNFFLS